MPIRAVEGSVVRVGGWNLVRASVILAMNSEKRELDWDAESWGSASDDMVGEVRDAMFKVGEYQG